MAWLEKRRFTSMARTLKVIARVVGGGGELDRDAVANIADVKPAAADRMIRAIAEHLQGIVEIARVGRRRVLRRLPPAEAPKLNIAVAVAACFGASLAPLFDGSNYVPGMRAALSYIVRGSRADGRFQELERKFIFVRRGGEISLPERAADLDEIVDAVLEHNPVRIKYRDFDGNINEREIQPLSIAIYDHQLYVIARRTGRPPHPYRFSRIVEVERLNRTFVYPTKAEYDPSQLFRDCFGIYLGGEGAVEDVVVHLHKRWTTYAQTHRWHESQAVEVHPDHVVIRLRVRVCPELLGWIRSFGSEARAITPETLRETLEGPSPS